MTHNSAVFRFPDPVTLIGAGELSSEALAAARHRAPTLVAADGGANRFWSRKTDLSAVIGDLDSLESPDAWRRALGSRVLALAEQETTDFEKCLYCVDAPFFLAVGFLGGRQDHALGAAHVLLKRSDQRIILVSGQEIMFLAPRRWRIRLPVGSRVSLFPLQRVRLACSAGLKWALDGLELSAGGQIGTSNESVAPLVEMDVAEQGEWPGLIAILERQHLDAALSSLGLLGVRKGGVE